MSHLPSIHLSNHTGCSPCALSLSHTAYAPSHHRRSRFFFFTCVSNLFKHSSQFSQVRSFAQEFCLLSTSFFISRFIIIDFNMLAGCVFLYCCIVSLMTLSLSCLMSMYRRGFRLTDKTSGQQRMWRATPHTLSCLWMSDGSKPPVVLYIQLNRIYTQCGTYPVEFQINSRSVR